MSGYITLNELYGNELPDRQDVFWEFVGEMDLDEPFPLVVVNPVQWFETAGVGDDIPKVIYEELATPDQKEIVEHYRNKIRAGETLKPTVFNDELLLDGWHRMTALALEGVTEFKAVQLFS